MRHLEKKWQILNFAFTFTFFEFRMEIHLFFSSNRVSILAYINIQIQFILCFHTLRTFQMTFQIPWVFNFILICSDLILSLILSLNYKGNSTFFIGLDRARVHICNED